MFPAAYAVDAEVASVSREDQIRVELFGENHERRVGVIHRELGILAHQLAGSPQYGGGGGNQNRSAGDKEVDARLASSLHSSEKVGGLRQHGLGAYDVPIPALERSDEGFVMRLAPVEKCDECARIEKQLICHVAVPR